MVKKKASSYFKIRATELFHKDSPFRQKIIQNKKKYNRKKDKKAETDI